MGKCCTRLGFRGTTSGGISILGFTIQICGAVAVQIECDRDGEDMAGANAAAVVPPLIELVTRLAA